MSPRCRILLVPPVGADAPRGPRWLPLLGVTLAALVSADAAHAQAGSGGGPPTIPGTAVVHVTPVSADTLPILCRDRSRPELGFVTESADPEWSPRFALSLVAVEGAPGDVEVVLELDGQRLSASFPSGASGEGVYVATAEVVPPSGSPRRMISFAADCRERLARGP